MELQQVLSYIDNIEFGTCLDWHQFEATFGGNLSKVTEKCDSCRNRIYKELSGIVCSGNLRYSPLENEEEPK